MLQCLTDCLEPFDKSVGVRHHDGESLYPEEA